MRPSEAHASLYLCHTSRGHSQCGLSTHDGSWEFPQFADVAIMTMLVSRYKIEVKEEPRFSGETFEERYARITAFERGLTTT